MASIREYVKKNGETSYYVAWRDPDEKKQTSLSFAVRSEALALCEELNRHGQRLDAVYEERFARSTAAPASEPGVLTLNALFEAHLDRLTKPSDDTVTGYRRIYKNRLGVTHGDMAAEDFTEDVAAAWVKGQLAKYTSKTVSNTTGLMSAAFKTAVRRGAVSVNPFDFVQLPDERRVGRKATFLTKAEFDLIHANMHPNYQMALEVEIGTGLRFSELAALRGADLHLTATIPSINVDKAWKEDGKRHRYIGPPKSETSIRTVSITSTLAERLTAASKRKSYAFTAVRGGAMVNKVFGRAWGCAVTAARKQGLTKSPRFHDLRHTHASWLLQEGVPIFVVSRRLGHASVDITTRLYGHITPEGQRQAVEGMERALGR